MDFQPIVIGAQYPGISRGLKADILATQALRGSALPVCTTHVVAGRGTVTDVLSVPTDTVAAQLEHVFETEQPSAAKVGIIGDASTVDHVFEHLDSLQGPVVLDLTVSGPSGEDVIGQRGLEVLARYLDAPDLVTLRRRDAALVAGMEIPSLDDAQIAAQRVAQQGAERTLIRCGRLPTHHFDTESDPPDYAVDLFFDGSDFAVFEAPFLSTLETLHGASSGLLLPLLRTLQEGTRLESALQEAKGHVSDALRAASQEPEGNQVPTFFRALEPADPSIAEM